MKLESPSFLLGRIAPCQKVGFTVKLSSQSVWQYLMYVVMAAITPLYYFIGVMLITDRSGLTLGLGVVLFFPVAMWFIRMTVESISPRGMFTYRQQARSFVVGAWLLLPFSLLAFARGWEKAPQGSLGGELDWVWMAYLLGAMLAVFHRILRVLHYDKTDRPSDELWSPTMLWRDFVVVPLLLSLTVWSGVPQLLGSPNGNTAIGGIMLLAFTVLLIVDILHPRGAQKRYPKWDRLMFQVLD